MHAIRCKVSYASILLILASELVSLSPVLCAQSIYLFPSHCSTNIFLNTYSNTVYLVIFLCRMGIQHSFVLPSEVILALFNCCCSKMLISIFVTRCLSILKYFTSKDVHIMFANFEDCTCSHTHVHSLKYAYVCPYPLYRMASVHCMWPVKWVVLRWWKVC